MRTQFYHQRVSATSHAKPFPWSLQSRIIPTAAKLPITRDLFVEPTRQSRIIGKIAETRAVFRDKESNFRDYSGRAGPCNLPITYQPCNATLGERRDPRQAG